MGEPEPRAPAADQASKSAERNLKVAIALFMAMITYGSLFPFAFHAVPGGIGPLRTLLGNWDKTPGRGDFVSNILLYMPLGFSCAISVGKKASLKRLGGAILIGATLSLSMEISQYYDTGRDTEATDFYANTIGTMLGAIAGWFFGQDFRWPLLRELSANRIPALLLAAWLGYRLYPYVPTISMHKYTGALRPLFHNPQLTAYGLFRQTAIWLAIRALIDELAASGRGAALFWRFAGFIFLSSVLIISTWINLAQVVGLVLAFFIWRALSPWPDVRTVAVVAVMGAYIVAFRLTPFRLMDTAGRYGMIPFFSFMRGSIDTDVQAFFEKFFLYGSAIWLLVRTGLSVRNATLLIAVILLATSFAEIYLPGRSAEVTDAVMALLIGAFVGSVETGELALPRFGNKPSDTLTRRIKLIESTDDAVLQPE